MVPHTSLINNTAGVILAGGRSRRFGSNKALALLDGKPIIQHVTEMITSLFSSCLIVANAPEEYTFLDLPIVNDIFQDAGPLAGIHAALNYTDQSQAFVVGCDMPSLNAHLIRYLCSIANTTDCHAVVPRLIDRSQPLYAVYKKTTLSVIEKNLLADQRRISDLLAELTVHWVDEETILLHVDSLTTFCNINQPDDMPG